MSKEFKAITSGFMWSIAERFGAQFVQFVVSIILARLIAPEIFGTIAIVTVLIQILEIFVDSGFGSAIVQKKEINEEELTAVFAINMLTSIVLYIGLFFVAPFVSAFYGIKLLTPVIRVLSVSLFFSGIKNIQHAVATRRLWFRKFFFASLIGTVLSSIVGIVMAFEGFGIWALVALKLTDAVIDAIVLLCLVKWHPTGKINLSKVGPLFRFGSKLFASAILSNVTSWLRTLLIGTHYKKETLGFYNQGEVIPENIGVNVGAALDSVLFPVMSKVQDNPAEVKKITQNTVRISSYILMPMMFGLIAVSNNFVTVLYTEKWAPMVPFLIIFALSYMTYPIQTANLNAIKSMGRSDMFLILEIAKTITALTAFAIALKFGVMALAISSLADSILSFIINAYPNRELISYKISEQIKDILPNFLMALSMGIIVFLVGLIIPDPLITLLIQIVLGVGIYVVESLIFKSPTYQYIMENIRNTKKG